MGIAAAVGVLAAAGLTLSAPAGASGSTRVSSATTATPCTSAGYTLNVGIGSDTAGTWSISVTGAVDFADDALSADVTLPSNLPLPALDGATVHAVLVGGTLYVSVPAGLSGFVGGASWVSMALPSAINRAVDGLLAEGAAWCASSQSLVTTLSRGAHVSTLGTSSIGAVSAQGTQITQSGRRVAHALKVPHALLKGARNAFGRARLGVQVWSDGQGHLVSLAVDGPSISVSLQLTDVDQPVSITAPVGAVPLSPSLLSLFGGVL